MDSSNVSNCTQCSRNDDAAVAERAGELFRVIFPIVVMFFGVPGNCLILRVFWNKPRKTTTNLLIMGLAWADLATCLLLVYFIVPAWTRLFGQQPSEAFRYVRYMLYSAASVSVQFITLIAFDRYDCVCRPHRRLLNPRKTPTAIICLTILALVLNVPYIGIAADYANAIHYTLVVWFIHIFWYIASLIVIIVCYTKVYKTIKKHARVAPRPMPQNIAMNSMMSLAGMQNQLFAVQNNKTSELGMEATTLNAPCKSSQEPQHSSARDASRNRIESSENIGSRGRRPCVKRHEPPNTTALQRKTTRMLLLASLVFLISWLPFWIYVLLVFAKFLGVGKSDQVYVVFYHCSLILYLNNAINPLIYGLANRRFRQDCEQALSILTFWRNN